MQLQTLKFGTDGWRAIIARDYTVDNVKRVALATAKWVKELSNNPSIVLGYDCRFGGLMFCEEIIDVMLGEGVKVYFDKNFVTTPMISLACKKLNASAGVIITASHNPPSYNGFKLKSNYGGPTIPKDIAYVESLIPNQLVQSEIHCFDEASQKGMFEYVDFEDMYAQHVEASFDLKAINDGKLKIAYDAMYGSGQKVFQRLVKNATYFHCEYNPSFYGQAPEPIEKNLKEISHHIADAKNVSLGVANDGDADRIGLLDDDGKFIDAHHIILLLIHILYKYKNLRGKVVVAFSVSPKVQKLCKAYGLDVEVTKIGFKYICEIMKDNDVLLGGEESGGIAVKGHIPERDGIWDALVILEYMALSGKSIKALINEVYEVVGAFSYNRNDLHLSEEKKQAIIAACQQNAFTDFGSFHIENVETIDGFKYHLNNEANVMIRPSGTEPVLRVYAEAPTKEMVAEVLKQTIDCLMQV